MMDIRKTLNLKMTNDSPRWVVKLTPRGKKPKCQIKPKTQKFKVLSVKGLLKNSDVYYLYPTCSLV